MPYVLNEEGWTDICFDSSQKKLGTCPILRLSAAKEVLPRILWSLQQRILVPKVFFYWRRCDKDDLLPSIMWVRYVIPAHFFCEKLKQFIEKKTTPWFEFSWKDLWSWELGQLCSTLWGDFTLAISRLITCPSGSECWVLRATRKSHTSFALWKCIFGSFLKVKPPRHHFDPAYCWIYPEKRHRALFKEDVPSSEPVHSLPLPASVSAVKEKENIVNNRTPEYDSTWSKKCGVFRMANSIDGDYITITAPSGIRVYAQRKQSPDANTRSSYKLHSSYVSETKGKLKVFKYFRVSWMLKIFVKHWKGFLTKLISWPMQVFSCSLSKRWSKQLINVDYKR